MEFNIHKVMLMMLTMLEVVEVIFIFMQRFV